MNPCAPCLDLETRESTKASANTWYARRVPLRRNPNPQNESWDFSRHADFRGVFLAMSPQPISINSVTSLSNVIAGTAAAGAKTASDPSNGMVG
jgi:hypothetical protein